MARPLHLAWALVLGACFTGGFLAGQPCMSDADCGPSLKCDGGFCGGASAGQTGAPESTSTSADPTTTGVDPTTTTVDPTTTTTVDPSTTGSTSTTDDTTTGGPTCGIGRCKDIDLLFVIDNSASMQDDFPKLISALGPFTDHLLPTVKNACSVHLGVVTTDAYKHNPEGCQQIGDLVRATDVGNECIFKEGLPYATLADLSNPTSLACILQVGSDGDRNERPIDAMFSAINADLKCNEGFYRPDAFLAVVLATDEDDDDNDAQGNAGSFLLPTDTWDTLLANAKTGGVDDIYVTAFLGDEDPNMANCSWAPLDGPDGTGSEHAPVLRSFVQEFGPEHTAIGSLCDSGGGVDYTALMMEIAAEITAACEG